MKRVPVIVFLAALAALLLLGAVALAGATNTLHTVPYTTGMWSDTDYFAFQQTSNLVTDVAQARTDILVNAAAITVLEAGGATQAAAIAAGDLANSNHTDAAAAALTNYVDAAVAAVATNYVYGVTVNGTTTLWRVTQ